MALAAQDGANPAFFGGAIGLGQDAQLVMAERALGKSACNVGQPHTREL